MFLEKEQVRKLQTCRELLLDILRDKELHDACVKLGTARMENPAVIFTRRAKRHEYDTVSDECYAEMLGVCEDACMLWQENRELSTDYRWHISALTKHISEVAYNLGCLCELDELDEKYGQLEAGYVGLMKEEPADMEHVAPSAREWMQKFIFACLESDPDMTPHDIFKKAEKENRRHIGEYFDGYPMRMYTEYNIVRKRMEDGMEIPDPGLWFAPPEEVEERVWESCIVKQEMPDADYLEDE